MRAPQLNRPFDHLYDNTYVTAHPSDHHRLTGRALYRPDKFKRVPDGQYLFSELAHYPRASIQMSSKEDLPTHVEKGWHAPQVPGPEAGYAALCGTKRPLYFKRPVVPTLATLPHIVMYDVKDHQQPPPQMVEQHAPMTTQAPETVVGAFSGTARTVGTQSLYRESEAQTVPYSAEYTVAPGHEPEVLTLTHLKFGQGLPASRLEIEIIERTRQKRLFDQMLPPPTDEYGFTLRSRLMEEQEFREWADREQKIKDLQEKRLQFLVQALRNREDKVESQHDDKVERLRKAKEEERDRLLAQTQRKRIQVLRKMFKGRQRASAVCDGKQPKRDVIAEYADFTSRVYAPVRRQGHVPDTKTAKIEVQPADLATYPGLTALERSLPQSAFKVKLDAPPEEKKRRDVMEQALQAALGTSKEQTGGEPGEETKDSRKKVVRTIYERPETPRVKEDYLPEEEQQQQAVLLLQRLLRGRARQNVMFEGKEKRLDLINELRAAERWDVASSTESERKATKQLLDRAVEGRLEHVLGTVVSETLDQLSKELLRFQEERRIAAMVKLAERDRRLRQARESGRRQAEERLRDREDKMFRQIMKVHQTTVDSYLEEVLTATVDQAAQSRALTEAKIKANKVNHVVDRLEQTYQDDQSTVRELVASFLLPHVERTQLQRRLKVEEAAFSKAALEGLDAVVHDVYSKLDQPPS